MKTNETPLGKAVAQTSDVTGHFMSGIQAVKKEYHSKIQVSNPRNLTGSIDIDTETFPLYPNENRWDYAIEYNKETFFVEFHPASTSNVDEMIGKLSWLDWWLKEKAPLISALKPKKGNAYHWVATGSIKILNGSRQYRQLAERGLLPKKLMVFK